MRRLVARELTADMSPTKHSKLNLKLKHFAPPDSPAANILSGAKDVNTFEALCAQILKANEEAVRGLAEFIDLV